MKKFTYLLFLALGVTACSVESIDSTENLLTADAKFSLQSTTTITAPAGDLCVGETYSFSVTANTNKTFQVHQEIGDGNWVQVYKSDNSGLQGTVYFDVVLLEGDNFFRTTSDRGFDDYPTSFVGVVCNPCENLLEAELSCEDTNTVTFTFTAEEAGSIVIQGGLTSGAEILNASSNVLTRVEHQSTGGPSNVTRWVGDVDACEVVTITIEFTGGDGIGDWTAKRGNDVLGETDAIECN